MESGPQTFIFAGKSGVGKGTQGALLNNYLRDQAALTGSEFELLYLETGQKFRSFMNGGTYAAKRAEEMIDRGGLLPAFLAVWNWTDSLNAKLKGTEHLIVDGTPRTIAEAQSFDEALVFYGRTNPYFFYLEAPDEIVTERLKERGRADDTPEAIVRRLAWFRDQVKPAVGLFRDNPKYRFVEIDSSGETEDVHQAIISSL
ncbi:MAG TPA: nucleoside monophosphate kinase [Candidatus Paceibacterota bacterium]|nr:nucleoside monophosphate kinase [Candidatus Paceibacterota bacterium]